jgi:hypothetical protein
VRQAQFRFSGKPPSLIIKHFDTWKLTKKKKCLLKPCNDCFHACFLGNDLMQVPHLP